MSEQAEPCWTRGYDHGRELRLALALHRELGFGDLAAMSDRFKLVYLEQGSGILTRGEKSWTVIAPALCCLDRAESAELTGRSNARMQTLLFHPAMVNDRLDMDVVRSKEGLSGLGDRLDSDLMNPFIHKAADLSGGIFNLGPANALRLRGLLAQLSHVLEDQPDKYWYTHARFLLIEILYAVYSIYIRINTAMRVFCKASHVLELESTEVDPVINWLLESYQQDISIADIVRRFNTNRNTLNKRFNAAIGQPVMMFLTRVRMFVAISLLEESDLPVGDIAERVGYASLTHFERMFRKHSGYSPAGWRRRRHG